MEACDYLGNRRELRKVLERAMPMADGDIALEEHLPPESLGRPAAGTPGVDDIVRLETAERRDLQWAPAHQDGHRKSLAAQVAVSERTLYRKLAG